MIHKILPLFLFLLVGLTLFLYLPARRFIAYNLNLSNDQTTSCCTVEEVLSANGEFDELDTFAIFNGDVIDYPKTSLAQDYQQLNDLSVLGTANASGETKWIEVSLNEQKLRAWEGDKIVMEFAISSGLWNSTPKGDFAIWYKTRRQKMSGGSKELGTYYYLPNVPNNMFFYKGFAIHGAYWHNKFGQPMSHGCINAPLSQVAQLFEWTGPQISSDKNVTRATAENPGTRVYIH